jgi:hypothetical protein
MMSVGKMKNGKGAKGRAYRRVSLSRRRSSSLPIPMSACYPDAASASREAESKGNIPRVSISLRRSPATLDVRPIHRNPTISRGKES